MSMTSRSKATSNGVTRGARAAAMALAVWGLVSGCSESDAKQEYDVPRALCGVRLDPDVVSPLLPAGRTIRVGETRPVSSRQNCRVDVDGHWAMMLNLEWWDEDVSSTLVASGNPRLEKAELASDGDFYSGTGAVKLVRGCKTSEHVRQLLYTSLQISDPDLGDIAAMKKLSADFTEAVGRSDACS
ncbi:hypothetical protein [Streptomyces sp. SID161]|uniref:hypothetical protein n=1 Tax=Streptomyces sp. SID161 TaxID=2690251 RepID=UPI00136B968A|nr:hypothetical protein [Streptomyces sp. SID161]MYW47983.1 hypothetical protein [Streptomyces sp. SID161]